MNRRIWKALGIAVCMLALAAPRAMAETHSHMVSNDGILKQAIKAINNSSDDNANEIILTSGFTLEGDTTEYTLRRGTTTIKGEGNTITVNPGAGIKVTGEKTVLNLGAEGYDKKLTIDGKTSGGSASGNAKNAFVSVLEGATANMYENVTLQNGEFADKACVVIKGSDSAFNMYGGVIENCSRAVIAGSGATFHMFDGEIKDCRAGGNRVISVNGGSKFIMDGGTISGCTADKGGGLYADNSIVTINNGTISGCKARMGAGGGLYATNQSTITIKDGTISGCEAGAGGGLYVDGSTVTISGGTISGCEAAINEGGGLYATNQSTITISGGTISGCKAPSSDKGNGSGLYANKSTVTISDGTISGCDGRWGGGLYAENSSTIEISGGTISRCNVGAGGGLFVDSSTIRISGGIISECTTSDTGNGGGLYAKNSTIKITGGRIENNKAALGGGVALIGKTTFEKPITNWTVIGNEAYATGGVGGGIKLENGSMDVSDGSNRIYNNTADGHGADICLTDDTSSIKLPNAANMGATYLDSGIYIDGWYNDNPRYTPSKDVNPVDVSKTLTGKQSLIASYKADPVRIEIDANGGVGGSGSQTVQKGTNITLQAPTKEGHLFTGWKDEKGNSYPAGEDGKVNITATGDMTLTAEWKKLPSAENLPKTGDESPVLLWGAALAVSAAACFMLRRKK